MKKNDLGLRKKKPTEGFEVGEWWFRETGEEGGGEGKGGGRREGGRGGRGVGRGGGEGVWKEGKREKRMVVKVFDFGGDSFFIRLTLIFWLLIRCMWWW